MLHSELEKNGVFEGEGIHVVSKELKRLSRRELIDIIYQLKKTEQKLQEENAALQEELQERRIRVSEAGSIAEAATSITNVFAIAQMTADLYLYEISRMKEETQIECKEMLEDARKAAEKIRASGAAEV